MFYKLGLPLVPALTLAWACAWQPQPGDQRPAGSASAAAPLAVVDHEGLAPHAEAERVLTRTIGDGASGSRARALAKEIQSQIGAPLVRGNRVRLLIDGPSTYRAMLAAVEGARDHIHIETYIFSDDEVGRRFAEALVRKRRAGVAVRVVYDAIGSRSSDRAFFASMSAHGIEVAEYRPLSASSFWHVNNRDHRKLSVIDGRIAFAGGLNISETYSQASTLRPGPDDGVRSGWRDTHLEVRGPCVRFLQAHFLRTWTRLGGRLRTPRAQLYPDLPEAGGDLVQVVASEGGDAREFRIYTAYLAAIQSARERIWISQAYFDPNAELRRALVSAAARGVDVRMIVPSFTDSALILHASRANYAELLDGGVAIYEHADALMHAKTAVVDGVWSTVGSANLDTRSFVHNDELNVAVLSVDVAREMEELFRSDLSRSERIDPEAFHGRPALDRIAEFLGSLLSYWL